MKRVYLPLQCEFVTIECERTFLQNNINQWMKMTVSHR